MIVSVQLNEYLVWVDEFEDSLGYAHYRLLFDCILFSLWFIWQGIALYYFDAL